MENRNLEMLAVPFLKALVRLGIHLFLINTTGRHLVRGIPGKKRISLKEMKLVMNFSHGFFSDECPEEEANDYAELNLPNQQALYLPGNYRKRSEEPVVRPLISQSLDCDRFRNLAMRTPERSIRSASVAVPRRRQRSRSASKQDLQNKTQVSCC